MPVHYTTDGGESWEEIDNTLLLSETAHVQAFGRAVREVSYSAENGDSARGFAQDLRSGFLFSAQNSCHSLRVYLTGMDASKDSLSSVNDTSETNAAEFLPEEFNCTAVAEISYPDEAEAAQRSMTRTAI